MTMTESTLAPAVGQLPTKPPSEAPAAEAWDDDASTLSPRSSCSSGRSRSEEALARLGWKSRPRESACREILKPNPLMGKPTPSIYLHGTGCTCKPSQLAQLRVSQGNTAKTDDDNLAERIMAAGDTFRAHKKRLRERQRQFSSSLITRIFRTWPAITTTTPSNHTVTDLCFGCSALDIAKVTRYLFDEDCPVPINAANHAGTTPLMAALRAFNPQLRPRAHLAMMAFLIECGADPNATSRYTTTPPRPGTVSILASAVSLELQDALRLLLTHGAAVDAPLTTLPMGRFGGHGLTALHVAAFEKKLACMEILLEHGGANVSATFDASRAVGCLEDVPKNKRDKRYWTSGITALHISDDSPECVELLLLHGADPTARDSYGRTPLHWAMISGNIEVVRQLLAAGMNPDVTDDDGATPFSELVTKLECGASRKGHPEIARLLLEAGADPDLQYPQDVSLQDRLLKMDQWREVYEPIFQAVVGGGIDEYVGDYSVLMMGPKEV